jgi:hypothetical protein
VELQFFALTIPVLLTGEESEDWLLSNPTFVPQVAFGNGFG